MEAKSNRGNAQFLKRNERNVGRASKMNYRTTDGRFLEIPVLPGNTPRVSGKRNSGDEKFLSSNNGKLA